MPAGKNLYSGRKVTEVTETPGSAIPIGEGSYIIIGVQVTEVTGGGNKAAARFGVQWSFDGDTWSDLLADEEDTVALMTGPGFRVKRIAIKGPYWRLGSKITGLGAEFTVTANALIW
jgi:hypothetical protein